MAEQLTFELHDAPAATFDNFVAGPNEESVRTLARMAIGEVAETCVVLWGAAGAGKTHLLRATISLAVERGRAAQFIGEPGDPLPTTVPQQALIGVDRIDTADEAAQARLFTLYNALTATGGQLVAAATTPPARLSLRDDLRTRLGWGLVFEIVPLADDEKPRALAAFAQARGFRLADDAIAYLLAHGRRDMASLVRALVALDRHSLARQRPITVPLIRDWLQADITLPPSGS